MPTQLVVRAWRDPVYRRLVQADADVPDHPSGESSFAPWRADTTKVPGFTAQLTCTSTNNTAARCCC